ncbi:MAG: metal-dependent hydrolase [Methanosarcina sp.]
MVNTLSHIGVGLLLSYALGLKGKKRLGLVFLSLLPDLDYFTYSIFTLISGSVSHEARNQLFYLLGHREFTHSIFFALLIALFIWIKTKDKTFTLGGFQAIFLHTLLDITTTSKMRIFYPFNIEASALRAIYSLDPVINFLPLAALLIVAAEYAKKYNILNSGSADRNTKETANSNISKLSNLSTLNILNIRSISNILNILNISNASTLTANGNPNFSILNSTVKRIWSLKNRDIWDRKLNNVDRDLYENSLKKIDWLPQNSWLNQLNSYLNRNERKLYASIILILLLWITVFPLAKIFLINHISDTEGTKISYKDTYPISPGKFLAAYSYDNTQYKLLKVSYWGGIEESFYVEKISVTGDFPDGLIYAEKAGELYSKSVPQAIDYPVYSVSEKGESVTVILKDARNPYVDKWPYFDTVYRFVFDKKTGEYEVYESHYGRAEKKLDKNYFE